MTEPLSVIARMRMTADAVEALRSEVDSLVRELDGRDTTDGADATISIDRARSARTLSRLREILESATVEDRPGVAVVGRRVTIRETSDRAVPGVAENVAPMTFSLVLPGDGDPSLGWVSIESPLAAAVCGRRAGDRTVVAAPGGSWAAAIVAVE